MLALLITLTVNNSALAAPPEASLLPAICEAGLGDGHSLGMIEFWYDKFLAEPARVIERYLAQPRHHPDPGFLGDFFRAPPDFFTTYANPEYNVVLEAVLTLHVTLDSIDEQALAVPFRDRPAFAVATLGALGDVVARLDRHLRARRGMEAANFAETTGRLSAYIAALRRRYEASASI